MATIEELQLRRNAVLERVESLQRRVTHGDKTVEYDLTSAKTALELLEREMIKLSAASSSSNGRVARQVRVITSKDL